MYKAIKQCLSHTHRQQMTVNQSRLDTENRICHIRHCRECPCHQRSGDLS